MTQGISISAGPWATLAAGSDPLLEGSAPAGGELGHWIAAVKHMVQAESVADFVRRAPELRRFQQGRKEPLPEPTRAEFRV